MNAMSTPGSMNEPYEMTDRNADMNHDFVLLSASNHKKSVRFDNSSESKIKI